jgi:hypothetical protein
MKNLPQTILVVGSCVALTAYKDLAFFSGFNRMLTSVILGASGAGLGALVYQLVSKQTDLIKYLTACGLCIVLITGAVLLPKNKPETNLEDKLTAIIDSAFKAKTDEIMHRPIDTNALKPPKLTPEQYAKLVTCEVCGYVALCPDSAYCYNCFNMKFDSKYIDDKHKWLRNEQSFWFSPDEKTNKVQFFDPKVENGFKKDPAWKPIVTEKEVRDYNKDK